MQINQYSLIEGAKKARGLTIIIDVFRAFTCAAYVFARGAQDIVLVGEVREAFELKKKYPDAILMGEIGGRHVEGFEFGNSPTHLMNSQLDWRGKRFIQRTSAGTQGVVNARGADEIILGNFVCASAIADYVLSKQPKVVSIVGMGDSGVATTDEDDALSAWLAARLRGEPADAAPYVARAREGRASKRFEENTADAPRTDVGYCLEMDRFNFVMTVAGEDSLLVAKQVALV